MTLFLCGDVMIGRGIDQILPRSVDPRLHERYVRSAETYVELAEEAHGPIPEKVADHYVWGDALDELNRANPHVRVVNLETAVTTSEDAWPGKAVHYRTHPGNVEVLSAPGVDVCVLANNHTIDWGRAGLRETLAALRGVGLSTAGAGADLEEATAPAVADSEAGRLLVFAYGSPDAGVPSDWAADEDHAGINLLSNLGAEGARSVVEHVRGHRRAGDRVLVSLHWGPNWGYAIPDGHRAFAQALIDSGDVDIVHGHSSHHPKGIEVYRDRPILYGCGDFINDYEGIGGRERFRGDLTLMYFPTLDGAGSLLRLEMTPLRIRRFRLERASDGDARWLAETLDRESRKLGARVRLQDTGRLTLEWR